MCILSDSVRAFKERNRLGRFADVDPEEQKRLEEEKRLKEEEEMAQLAKMTIGDRWVVLSTLI